MRSGWLGGIAAGLIVVLAVGNAYGSLTVNGRLLSTGSALRFDAGVLFVPLLAVAPELGIEITSRDGRWAARWSGGCGDLATWELRDFEGVAYATLDGLVARVGGVVRRVPGGAEVDVPSARVIEVAHHEGQLVVRFSRFAPALLSEMGGLPVVRFTNCGLGVAEAEVMFGPGDIATATLSTADGAACEVRVAFAEEAALSIQGIESENGYAVFFSPADTPAATWTVTLGCGVSFSESELTLDGAPARVEFVSIEAWRGRLDVRPLLPPAGIGTRAGLDEVLAETEATAVLTARSGGEPGLVVIDGVPFSLGQAGDPAVGIDVFDSLVALVPQPVLWAVSGATRIALEGIDRPIGTDEVIGYPAGYTGSVSRGFADRFCVVRVREGVVVSVLDALFVVADPSATLLVASGAARERIAWLAMGDRIEVTCDIDPSFHFVRNAWSVDGSLLSDGARLSAHREPATSWSVLGTDWQGGLFLLRASGATPLSEADILAVLAGLSTPTRDAVVLERGGTAGLALDLGNYHPRWGSSAPIVLALGVFLE